MLCIELVLWIVEPLLLELEPLFISLGVSPVGEGVVGVAKLDKTTTIHRNHRIV